MTTVYFNIIRHKNPKKGKIVIASGSEAIPFLRFEIATAQDASQ